MVETIFYIFFLPSQILTGAHFGPRGDSGNHRFIGTAQISLNIAHDHSFLQTIPSQGAAGEPTFIAGGFYVVNPPAAHGAMAGEEM